MKRITASNPFRFASLCAFFLVLMAAPLHAQTTASSDELSARVQSQVEDSLERLALTDDQREPVRLILEATFADRLAVMERHGVDPAQLQAGNRPGYRTMRRMSKDIDRVRKATERQLQEVLTEDQMDVWSTMEDERRARMRAQLTGG